MSPSPGCNGEPRFNGGSQQIAATCTVNQRGPVPAVKTQGGNEYSRGGRAMIYHWHSFSGSIFPNQDERRSIYRAELSDSATILCAHPSSCHLEPILAGHGYATMGGGKTTTFWIYRSAKVRKYDIDRGNLSHVAAHICCPLTKRV